MAQSDVSVEGGGEGARTGVTPEDFDVSQRTDVAKLRKGAVGLGGVHVGLLLKQSSHRCSIPPHCRIGEVGLGCGKAGACN